MIALILKSTALLLVAALLDLGLLRRRGSAAARHLVWTLAVVALLALPLATVTLPAWRVIDVRAAAQPEATTESVALRDDGAVLVRAQQTASAAAATVIAPRVEAGRASEPALAAQPASAARAIDLRAATLVAYAFVALLLLLKVLMEHVTVARLTRACRPIEDADWQGLLASVRASLGVRRDVALIEGPASVMPLTWGVRHPVVLLPETAAAWPLERRRAVLLHEVGHVARNDCATQTLAAVVRALYWAHPGAWLAAQRLRVERELACDELAVSRGIPRLSYAEHLLEIARSYRAPRLSAGAVAMARSRIEARLRSLIEAPRATGTPSPRAKLLATAAACALLLPLAAMAPAVATQTYVTGRWDLRLAAPDEGEGTGTLLHLMLRAPGMNTQYLPIDAFDGLTLADMRRDAPATFTLRRGAGTFRFEGRFVDERGSGTFVFTPDARFGDALVARGMARPTEAQLFTLARHGMELDFLDELAAQGYPQPTTDLFVRTSLTGVDLTVLRQLRAERTRFGSLEMLVDAWNHGRVAAAPPPLPPVPGLPAEEAVPAPEPLPGPEPAPEAPPAPPSPDGIGAVGVTPAALPVPARAPAPAAAPPALPSQPDARGVDVAPAIAPPPPPPGDPAEVRPVAAPPAPPETPRSGAWNIIPARGGYLLEIFWDDDTQWRRGFDMAELTSVPADGGLWLIDRDAGRFEMRGTRSGQRATGRLTFTPKREFGQLLRRLGLTPERRGVTDHDLKNLTWGGIGEREVRAFQAQFDDLTFDELVAFAVRGVTPSYVEAMRAEGVEVRTARDIIELRFADVTVADVRALRDAGQRDMSAEAVVGGARRRG